MDRKIRIDLLKLAAYILRRAWLVVLCMAVGFGVMYWRTVSRQVDTYTASGTMYVYNGNPNLINYQYASASDLNSAVQLLDTYMVVVKSNKVMDAVVDRLSEKYPGIQAGMIVSTLSMGSVSETGVMRVSSTALDPQLAADICNAVLDVVPAEIIRVVGAGNIEVIDYASVPAAANARSPMRKALLGAAVGAAGSVGLIALFYLVRQRIAYASELTDNYTPPVLSSIKRFKKENNDPAFFVLGSDSPIDIIESYSKLRMNMLYTLVGKDDRAVAVTSSIAGEGKSTITANLAISCAGSGKKVLLVDADMRRACQQDIFHYKADIPGLSNVLTGEYWWNDVIFHTQTQGLDVMPAGQVPPNPAELLGSPAMRDLLKELEGTYDLVLLDTPPINIVSDPLALSAVTAGSLIVVRQDFSDHRELRKALKAAELTGMNVLGFVFYGENVDRGSYYNRRYYKNYYNKYEHRDKDQSGERPARHVKKG